MDFSKVNIDSYDKYTFGKCIRQQREELKLSIRSVATRLGISAVYLADIEKGKRYAPTTNDNIGILYRLIKILDIPDDQVSYVIDMAYSTRGCSKEIIEYISKNKKLRKFIRITSELDLSDNDWDELLEQLINKGRSLKK